MQYDELGKFIKLKRINSGLSLNKFAQEADIDCAILCRIENLKQGIKINIKSKLFMQNYLENSKAPQLRRFVISHRLLLFLTLF